MSHQYDPEPPPSVKCLLPPPPPPAGDPLDRWYCRCDHPHHPDARWCYVCEYPIRPAAGEPQP